MRLLITGGSGFIGRNLAEQLRKSHDVWAPSRSELDLLDAPGVRAYLESYRFDAVIHAASEGVTGRTAGQDVVAHNCRMFFNLARNNGAFGRLLFLSSGAVYDQAHWRASMPEDYFDTHVPADPYGFSKYVCAHAIGTLDRVYEMRVFGVVGPYEDYRSRFISNTCCRALYGLPVKLRRNIRFDYLDVLDLGGILECCLTAGLKYRAYNVCRGIAFELPALAARIGALAGRTLEITMEDHGPAVDYSGDRSRLLAEFPGLRFRAMDESLERVYRWYAERKASIDPQLLG